MSTNPQYDFSDLGAIPEQSSSEDFSDLGAIPEINDTSRLKSFGAGALKSGIQDIRDAGQGILNTFVNPDKDIQNIILKSTGKQIPTLNLPKVSKDFMYDEQLSHPNYYKAGEFLESALPYAISGPEEAGLKFENFISSGLKKLTNAGESGIKKSLSNFAGRTANTALKASPIAALQGAIRNPDNPLEGSEQNLLNSTLYSPIGQVSGETIGSLFKGLKGVSSSIKNSVLDYLEKQSKEGNASTPEEAKQLLSENYTTDDGNLMNVDIGTLTNNPELQGAYNKLRFSPGSGVSKNKNILNRQLIDKNISNTNKQLTESTVNNQLAPLENEAQNLGNRADLIAQARNENFNQANNIANDISNAPKILDSLASSSGDPINANQSIKESLTNLLKDRKNTAKEIYAPSNENADLRFDHDESSNNFPNLKSELQDLEAHKINSANIFGNDSLIGKSLNSAFDKASSMVNGQNKSGVTLGDTTLLSKHFGDLSRAAYQGGDRVLGSKLNALKEALDNDQIDNLKRLGRDDIAQSRQQGNTYYKEKILPIYKSKLLNQVTSDKNNIPQGSKIAQLLHTESYHDILHDLPSNIQKTLFAKLINQESGNEKGFTELSPTEIAKNYKGLDSSAKLAISKYAPAEQQYLSSLSSKLQDLKNRQFLSNQQSSQLEDLRNQQGRIENKLSISKAKQDKQISDLTAKLQQLHEQKVTYPRQGGFGEQIGHALITAGPAALAHFSPLLSIPALAGIVGARGISKILRDPELIKAYANKTRFSTNSNAISQSLRKNLPKMISGGLAK